MRVGEQDWGRAAHTLALLLSVLRWEVFVGDRSKTVNLKTWAITIVAPKSVGSRTTKAQMKPAFEVSSSASQAGKDGQSHTATM